MTVSSEQENTSNNCARRVEAETDKPTATPINLVRQGLEAEISKQVVRKKLAKQRHLVLDKAIDPAYLESIFPQLVDLFEPQPVEYNGGRAGVRRWRISCYLEVMPGGIPTTLPNLELKGLLDPLLNECSRLFQYWYRQQHACNNNSNNITAVERLMTFVTRYRHNPGEEALLKVSWRNVVLDSVPNDLSTDTFFARQHVDGAGKVDGSVVVALPTDDAFEGGGLTFWDRQETHYDTRAGDLAFIDRYVGRLKTTASTTR